MSYTIDMTGATQLVRHLRKPSPPARPRLAALATEPPLHLGQCQRLRGVATSRRG